MTETTESRQPQSAQAAHETRGSLENPPPGETSAGTAVPQETGGSVERVTDVATARPTARLQQPPKDPKRVSAGRAGAAAKKAKKERLLEELRAAKESFCPGEASILPCEAKKEAELKDQAPARADKPLEHSWIPWIIGVALGAAGGALMFQQRLCRFATMQPPSQSNPASEAAGSRDPLVSAKRQLVATPRQQPIVERHLEKRDPFHME